MIHQLLSKPSQQYDRDIFLLLSILCKGLHKRQKAAQSVFHNYKTKYITTYKNYVRLSIH